MVGICETSTDRMIPEVFSEAIDEHPEITAADRGFLNPWHMADGEGTGNP